MTLDIVRRARTRRYRIVVGVLVVLLAALMLAFAMIGDVVYPITDILAVLSGQDVPGASFNVGQRRLPAASLAVLAGIAFGISGSVFQNLLRNDLASPDIIGISSGSSTAAVFGLLVLGLSGPAVSALAVIAGIAIALLIAALAAGRGGFGGRLILIGIGVSAMLVSVTSYLLMYGNVNSVPAALRWLNGSLNNASWDDIPVLLIAVVVCGGGVLALQRNLLPMELGDEAATGLGVRVQRSRLALMLLAVALTAFATAASGPISFVAFLSGPIALRLTGRSNHSPIVPAALVGAVLVLACELIGQHALGVRLPVGVVTGLMGAPFFLYLLIRSNRKGAQ
ncbi:FecCD family ABC transporter permease [Gulosibacter sp. ACHW.36C]|uniref:Iron ABC transporter permease n=1 Tax=Gulosibacter sediminis TaxID=1729695 RepID=A0ABY4MV53_9MICO|nr:iron ABC transporter permease [Gulosibacter sediminis]UQN14296.1 iron ABC transporter permease [Gulosibacter sediminis]